MHDDTYKQVAPIELGRRLAVARRCRNLSQEAAAQKLEVSRPTLIAIEKGTRSPKPQELLTLAELYGRSMHELVSQREFIAEFAPSFRVTQAKEVSPEALMEATHLFRQVCEDYLTLEALLNAPMLRYAYPEPYQTGGLRLQEAAEEIALSERSRLSLGLGSIPNLLEVLENEVGLRVFALPLAEFKIAGMFAYSDRFGGCIFINGRHPATRQRWTMAHEYAHFLTDRYREEVTILFEQERKPNEERLADAFAAAFLMPAPGVRQRFRRIVQSRSDFTVADLCLLADQYAVSVEAMTLRLESLGCIQKGMWDQLRAQGFQSARAQKSLGISASSAAERRLPERYARLAVQAFEEARISETELARLLHCHRVEARELVQALTRPMELSATGETYHLNLDFGDALSLPARENAG